MQLARKNCSSIISADSRQVYRGFDIGTAKPAKNERKEIRHYGIDVADPTERYSAAQWAESSARWIEASKRDGRTPLIVGGTGLYIRSLFQPLFQSPQLDKARRALLQVELADAPIGELRAWTKQLDPDKAHLGRTQLIRAIEVALLTGRKLSSLQKTSLGAALVKLKPRYLVIDPGEKLAQQIESRVDAMLNGGWIDEVRELMRVVPEDAPAWKSSGYAAVREIVSGSADLSSTRQRIIIETRQYAKRQRTWFRNQLPEGATRLDPTAPDFEMRLEDWWSKASE